MLKTFGRNPTLAEVKWYYTREDILAFIHYACKKRNVTFSFRDEPNLKSESGNVIDPQSPAHLRDIIVEGIAANIQGIADEGRLQAYPSFHSLTSKDGDAIGDFVMEADCHGWRRSFVDVRGAIEVLNDFQVPYIAKFSGHRSLHVMIPREAFPGDFDGVPINQAWKMLEKRLRDFFSKYARVRYAHGTGGILRLPYSLNENTGMVSLPVCYDELDDFRPWEAIPHLVENVSLSLFEISDKDRDKTGEFLQAALTEKRINPIKQKMWQIRTKQNIDKYRNLLDNIAFLPTIANSDDPAHRAEAAWKLMVKGLRVPEEVFEKYSKETNPDVRWFIAEAMTNDERSLKLLHEMDEYAANAVVDSVSMAPFSFLENLLKRAPDWKNSLGTMMNIQAVAERCAETLKDELIRQAEVISEDDAQVLLKCASVLGNTSNDWNIVKKTASIIESRFPEMAGAIPRDVFDNI